MTTSTYNPSDYPPFAVTVDLAIMTIDNGRLSVLLVERKEAPHAGQWALPGGFVRIDEDTTQAAHRELLEETGLSVFDGHLEQLRTYSAPSRDPRMRVVSVAHVAFTPNLGTPHAGTDAAAARWWALDDLLADNGPTLAFDHAQILRDAIERVQAKLEYTTLATSFLPEEFTLADLHRVYTTAWGTRLDLGNFRRKVLGSEGFVVPTGTSRPGRGRAAALYTRGPAQTLQPPILRSETDQT